MLALRYCDGHICTCVVLLCPYLHLGSTVLLFGRKNVDKHFGKYEFLVFLILTKSSMRLFFFFGREKEMVGTELK